MTVWQNSDSEGYISLHFTSKSMRLTNAAGEFNGFAYDANRGVWKGGETLLNDVYNLIDVSSKIQYAVSWIESRVEQVFDNFTPFSNSNEQNGFFDIIENMNAILNKPLRLIQENGDQESEMLYSVVYVNEDGSLRYEYERGGRIINTSGTNNFERRRQNELDVEKPTDGVMLTNMTEDQFNRAMDIVEGNFIRRFFYQLISSDSREFKQTVTKLEEMNKAIIKLQETTGTILGDNGKPITLRQYIQRYDYLIIGEEGKGSNKTLGFTIDPVTKQTNHKDKDQLNDKFTVFKKDVENGVTKYTIGEFIRVSLDSTNYNVNENNVVVGYDGKKHFGTAAPHIGLLQPFIRQKKVPITNTNTGVEDLTNVDRYIQTNMVYFAWRDLGPKGDGKVPALGINWGNTNQFNIVTNDGKILTNWYLIGELIHANKSKSNNDSKGCQVVYYEDYIELIKMFGEFNSLSKKWNFSSSMVKKGYYFLISQ